MSALYGPGTSVRCPRCGARGAETCTTKDGRDHLARATADDERRETAERLKARDERALRAVRDTLESRFTQDGAR